MKDRRIPLTVIILAVLCTVACSGIWAPVTLTAPAATQAITTAPRHQYDGEWGGMTEQALPITLTIEDHMVKLIEVQVLVNEEVIDGRTQGFYSLSAKHMAVACWIEADPPVGSLLWIEQQADGATAVVKTAFTLFRSPRPVEGAGVGAPMVDSVADGVWVGETSASEPMTITIEGGYVRIIEISRVACAGRWSYPW